MRQRPTQTEAAFKALGEAVTKAAGAVPSGLSKVNIRIAIFSRFGASHGFSLFNRG